MTQQQSSLSDIDARLAKANSDCAKWLAAGEAEKYLEACSEVLELEQSRIAKDALRKAQNKLFTGDTELSWLGVSSDHAKLMSALTLAYDGCRCHGYGKLESAQHSAKLQPGCVVGATRAIATTPAAGNEPSDSERETMNPSVSLTATCN